MQFGLDIVGMLPISGVSMAADLINAGISALRGDWVGCGMSLLGAIPGVGSVATAGKMADKGTKAVKAADKTVATLKTAKSAVKAFKQADKLTDAGKLLVKSARFVMNAVDVTQAVYTDAQIIMLMAQGEFNPFEDVDDARLAIQALQGNISVGKNMHDNKKARQKKDTDNPFAKKTTSDKDSGGADVPTKKTGDKKEPQGDTAKQKKTNQQEHHGDAQKEKTCINDPVDVVTGSMSIRHVDMLVRYTGGNFYLIRNYESVHENPGKQLGSRWVTNLESSLSERDGIYSILLEDMHIERFRKTATGYESLRKGDKSVTLSDIEDGDIYTETKRTKKRGYLTKKETYRKSGTETAIAFVSPIVEKNWSK